MREQISKLSIIEKDREKQKIVDKINEIIEKVNQFEIAKKPNNEIAIKLNSDLGAYTSVSGTFELE